jgi:hypothetical protein
MRDPHKSERRGPVIGRAFLSQTTPQERANYMPESNFAIPTAARLEQAVELNVRFHVDGLTPRAVRRRFVDCLRIEIARGRVAHEFDVDSAIDCVMSASWRIF